MMNKKDIIAILIIGCILAATIYWQTCRELKAEKRVIAGMMTFFMGQGMSFVADVTIKAAWSYIKRLAAML